ncbi:MAG TPA: hypothetical protein VHR45_10060 [Thermoanaerobaculia bacterium]|nr:hypothetical protein [Thermoanaerobaculia bacterium]
MTFTLFNGPPGGPDQPAAIAFGYELRRNGMTMASDSCGNACTIGCDDNADFPQGEIFSRSYRISN